MNETLLNEALTKWLLLERRHSMYHDLLKTKSDLQNTAKLPRTKYGRDPPSRPSIREWRKKFMETGTSVR